MEPSTMMTNNDDKFLYRQRENSKCEAVQYNRYSIDIKHNDSVFHFIWFGGSHGEYKSSIDKIPKLYSSRTSFTFPVCKTTRSVSPAVMFHSIDCSPFVKYGRQHASAFTDLFSLIIVDATVRASCDFRKTKHQWSVTEWFSIFNF